MPGKGNGPKMGKVKHDLFYFSEDDARERPSDVLTKEQMETIITLYVPKGHEVAYDEDEDQWWTEEGFTVESEHVEED